MEFKHKPVMLDECLEMLNIKEDGIYVDGTLGGAGHSFHILEKLSNKGKLIGIDRDKEALLASSKRLENFNNKILYHGNHDDIKYILNDLNIDKVDGILLDLGVSSYQIDEKDRGFSYTKDSVLDMRMNREDKLSAYDVVNKYSLDDLIYIFKEYGEERYSKRIAEKIVEVREKNDIKTTFELVDIIKSVVPFSEGHPAKRVFQAIRIEVNNELSLLKNTVEDCIKLLNNKGRLVIITFHSLEDRIVKKAMEDMEGRCTCPKDFPVCVCNYKSYGKVITKKVIVSKDEELKNNSRAKSAKLRVFERKM